MNVEQLDALVATLPPRPAERAQIETLNVRPGPGLREERDYIELDPVRGAIGDRWEYKTWLHLPDGQPDPRVQLALCNTSLIALMQKVSGSSHHPGDTIFSNLDLSATNLPVGTRLRVGTAIIEISDVENDACAKFAAHYGNAVLEWIRHAKNRPLRLRGAFAKVVEGGIVHIGDQLVRL